MLIEISLLVPMLFFLFLGMVNVGFYIYAFISVGNAARVAAQYTGTNFGYAGDSNLACEAAWREMWSLPNVDRPASCTGSGCCTGDLQVTATYIPAESMFSTPASRVTVTYTTIQLFPLPFMSGRMVINRIATMPVINTS